MQRTFGYISTKCVKKTPKLDLPVGNADCQLKFDTQTAEALRCWPIGLLFFTVDSHVTQSMDCPAFYIALLASAT